MKDLGKKIGAGLLSMSMFAGAAAGTTNAAGTTFKDIQGHWAQSTITQALNDGYIKGYQDGTFKPNGIVTRAEFAAMLTRGSKLGNTQGTASFSDVPPGHWAHEAVTKAVGMGFIKPSDYASGKFNPNVAMTRFEMAKWLSNGLAGSDESYAKALQEVQNTILPFTEFYKGGIGKAQVGYLALVMGTGIITGYPDGSFGGNKNVTRAETVAMLYRYLGAEGKKADNYRALSELREVGTTGTNIITMSGFRYGPQSDGTFKDVIGQPLYTRSNIGELRIHHFIVIDPWMNAPYQSIYTDMFMYGKALNQDFGEFEGFVDFSLKPLVDNPDPMKIRQSGETSPTTIFTMPDTKAKQYGFPVISTDNGYKNFKAGITGRAWGITATINKNDPFGDSVVLKNKQVVYWGGTGSKQ